MMLLTWCTYFLCPLRSGSGYVGTLHVPTCGYVGLGVLFFFIFCCLRNLLFCLYIGMAVYIELIGRVLKC